MFTTLYMLKFVFLRLFFQERKRKNDSKVRKHSVAGVIKKLEAKLSYRGRPVLALQ